MGGSGTRATEADEAEEKVKRLTGWAEIVAYFGYSPKNKRAIERVKRRYGEAIMRDRETGRVWAMEEHLRALEGQRSAPVSQDPVKPRLSPALSPPYRRHRQGS